MSSDPMTSGLSSTSSASIGSSSSSSSCSSSCYSSTSRMRQWYLNRAELRGYTGLDDPKVVIESIPYHPGMSYYALVVDGQRFCPMTISALGIQQIQRHTDQRWFNGAGKLLEYLLHEDIVELNLQWAAEYLDFVNKIKEEYT